MIKQRDNSYDRHCGGRSSPTACDDGASTVRRRIPSRRCDFSGSLSPVLTSGWKFKQLYHPKSKSVSLSHTVDGRCGVPLLPFSFANVSSFRRYHAGSGPSCVRINWVDQNFKDVNCGVAKARITARFAIAVNKVEFIDYIVLGSVPFGSNLWTGFSPSPAFRNHLPTWRIYWQPTTTRPPPLLANSIRTV